LNKLRRTHNEIRRDAEFNPRDAGATQKRDVLSLPSIRQQIPECGLQAGGVLDGLRHAGAIVSPDVSRTNGVAKKTVSLGPVIAHGDVRRAFVQIQVKPVLEVVHILAYANSVNGILADDRARLGGERVNAGGIAHARACVMNVVGVDAIIAKATVRLRPPPTDADARVGKVRNLIMLDGHIACVTHANADGPPIFIRTIRDKVVGDLFARANLSLVSWVIGHVRLKTSFAKIAHEDSISADVAEDAAFNNIIMGAPAKIQSCGGEALELATLKTQMMRRAD
jgi:hypothetical protein